MSFNLYYYTKRVGELLNSRSKDEDIKRVIEKVMKEIAKNEERWNTFSSAIYYYTFDVYTETVRKITPIEKISHDNYTFYGIVEGSTRKKKFCFSYVLSKDELDKVINLHDGVKKLYPEFYGIIKKTF